MPKNKSIAGKNSDDLFNGLLGDKELGFLVGDDPTFEYRRISFGIPQLDKITNGGIPAKKMFLMFGGWSSGKSYILLCLIKSVQESGGVAAVIDTELSWDANWAEQNGVDPGQVLVMPALNAEQAYQGIYACMKKGVTLIGLDSIAGLIPTSITEDDDLFNYNPMAWQARSWNQAIVRFFPLLRYGSTMVAINQVRGSMGPVSAIETMPGGKGQQFFAHGVLETRRGKYITEKQKRVGFDIQASLLKDKFGGERWEQVTIPFRLEGGIDPVETYLKEAVGAGLITQKGAWYSHPSFPGETIQGWTKVRDYYHSNPQLFEELKLALPE
tara:strand:+ start:3381 stop:4361 length:981 start_codon:yes stop_codon:yes gene_type:complete